MQNNNDNDNFFGVRGPTIETMSCIFFHGILLHFLFLRYVMLRYDMLCYAMLCYAMLAITWAHELLMHVAT